MKRLLAVLFLLTAISLKTRAQKQVFSAPNLKQVIATHKVVAILPLKVTISYKRFPKSYDPAANAQQEKDEGVNMQQGMYTYLLRKASNYTVSFQEVQRTDILLKQAGIYNKLDSIPPDSICKILKVDGVVQASYAYARTGSEAGAIILTVMTGYGGSVGSGALTMQVYNGADGELLWRFYKEMGEGAFTNADALMERMMRKVARNFPYEK